MLVLFYYLDNLPYDCQIKSLYKTFGEFGEIEEIKMVKDRITGLPKGSAFIKYKEKESADKICNEYEHDESDKSIHSKEIKLNERVLIICRALTKDSLKEY